MNRDYILLIEDNKFISDSMIWAIEYEHHKVIARSNGQEALECLGTAHYPFLILLDMMMPVMDGFKFREYQHANPQLGNIPTVLMSSRSNLENNLAPFTNEILIPKPFDINELMEIIKRLAPPRHSTTFPDRRNQKKSETRIISDLG